MAANTARLPWVNVTSASASGYAVDPAHAPASISVIDHDQLEDKSYRDIRQALQDVPGVYVDDGPTSKGGVGAVSIRGMDSKYTLILVDGKPQSSQQGYYNGFGAGAEFGWLPPISAIERIEVIRGPMSTLYGSDALGGVINVITKPVPTRWHGTLSATGTLQENDDSGDRAQGRYQIGGPLVADKLAVSAYGQRFQRNQDDIEGGYNQYDQDSNTLKFDWAPNEDHDFSLEGGVAHQRVVGDAERVGRDNELRTTRYHEALTHHFDWGDGADTDSYLQHAKLDNRTQNAIYQRVTTNTRTTVPLASQRLSVGARYRYQQTENPSRALGAATLRRWDTALFAEDEWFITEAATLTGGLRWVYDENYGSQFVPRVYGVYGLTDALTLKGGVSGGYRTPDLKQGDSNWIEGGGGPGRNGGDIGNSELEPEKSTTYEIALLWRGDQGIDAGVTLYQTDYRDKIEKPVVCDVELGDERCLYRGVAYDVLSRYENVDKARVRGVETSLGFALGPAVTVRASYTFTNSEQLSGDNDGLPLNDQPRHRANISADWALTEATRAWAQARYKGEAEQVGGRRGLSIAYPDYTLVDAGLRHALTEHIDLFASVDNVFNKSIRTPEYGRILDGRRYNAGFRLGF